jgi:hypothetical protein
MTNLPEHYRHFGGSAPATPGFNAFWQEWLFCFPVWGRAFGSSPTIPAAEAALGSHPCVALSSAQVFPEWTTNDLAVQ